MNCDNYEPITLEALAKNAGVTEEEAKQFIDDEFGSYENYVRACLARRPLDKKLSELVAESN